MMPIVLYKGGTFYIRNWPVSIEKKTETIWTYIECKVEFKFGTSIIQSNSVLKY